MPGAVARPSKSRGQGGPPPEGDDAFVRALNRFIAWARENTGILILAGVVLVVGIGAAFYWRSYQQNLEDRAAGELETLQARLARGSATALTDSLRGFLRRFDGTRAAREARILLARQQLAQDSPSAAVEAIRPVVGANPPDSPTGFAARSLLAEAWIGAGDTASALSTLEELAEGARFPFQRRQAAAERASLLANAGRLEEAREVYRRLAEEASGTEAGDLYELRLGEVEARLASGGASEASAGGADGSDEVPAVADTASSGAPGG